MLQASLATMVTFGVAYVAMARKVTTAGGFYSFISHGLGRELGMAAGFLMVSATPLTRSSYHADADFAELRAVRQARLAPS